MAELPRQLESYRDRKCWTCYTFMTRDNGKRTKPPINPYTLRFSDIREPSAWSDFQTAVGQTGKPCNCRGGFIVEGVGIVLDAAELVGVDIDHCIEWQDGKAVIDSTAREIWQTIHSYTELSPSKTGVHILIGGATKPDRLCKVQLGGGVELELYDSWRYFTVTGKPLFRSPEIRQDGGDAVSALYQKYFGGYQESLDSVSTTSNAHTEGERGRVKNSLSVSATCRTGESVEVERQDTESMSNQQLYDALYEQIHTQGKHACYKTDAEVLDSMFSSANGRLYKALWGGDCSSYDNDHSKADLALCEALMYFCDGDRNRVNALFRQSGLYRDKWERSDYRKWTLDRATR